MHRRLANYWIGLLIGALVGGPFVRAQQPQDVSAPSGAIADFDRTTATGCPSGWTELTASRGYYLVGLVSGGTRGTAVGTALTDQENRNHTHTFAHSHDITHSHTYAGTLSAPSATTNRQQVTADLVATSDHTHTFSGTTASQSTSTSGAESTANTWTQSAMMAPYLQYLRCKRT